MKSFYNQRTYEKPRISLKMLCEYVNASASRRSTIIKDSSVVPTYIAKRYNLASDIISTYLASDKPRSLKEDITSITMRKFNSPYERDMAYLSAEAVIAFASHAETLKKVFSGLRIEQSVHDTSHKLVIESVEISIRPELIIRDALPGSIIGFIKFYLSKTEPLDVDSASLIACLGRNYFKDVHLLDLNEKNCFVLDVFRGDITTAPKSFKRRMMDIAASCREIADRWSRFIN